MYSIQKESLRIFFGRKITHFFLSTTFSLFFSKNIKPQPRRTQPQVILPFRENMTKFAMSQQFGIYRQPHCRACTYNIKN